MRKLHQQKMSQEKAKFDEELRVMAETQKQSLQLIDPTDKSNHHRLNLIIDNIVNICMGEGSFSLLIQHIWKELGRLAKKKKEREKSI